MAGSVASRAGGASARPASRWAGLPAALATGLLAASCGPGDNDPGPGGVTVGEARALDEAAEMLDEQQPPEAPPSGEAAAPAADE